MLLAGRGGVQVQDMQRVLDECTEMGVRLRDDDGPNAELRCWRQRVAMLSTIEKQLETHECQLVSRNDHGWDPGCILSRVSAIVRNRSPRF